MVEALRAGTMKIRDEGHLTNSLIDKMEGQVEHWNKMLAEYLEKDPAGPDDQPGQNARMADLYRRHLEEELDFGRYAETDQYCFNCDAHMYVIPIDEKTAVYCGSTDYWRIAEASGKKYDYAFKETDVLPCAANHLTSVGHMTADVEFATGRVRFVNHFYKTFEDLPKDQEYSSPGLCSVLGRERIMKHLAAQNIGYGQMGNMSLSVYSNDVSVILGMSSDIIEDRTYDTENALAGKYGNEYTDEERGEMQRDLEKMKKFSKELEDGGYTDRGEISLGMWRWMCADESLIKSSGAKFPKECGSALVRLKPGRYRVSHFYDMSKGDDPIYSRIEPITE